MIDLEELPDCLPQQLHHFTSTSLGESMCVWAANPLLTPALSTALGPSLQSQHSTHSQEDSPTQSPRSTGMETRAGGRGDLCA